MPTEEPVKVPARIEVSVNARRTDFEVWVGEFLASLRSHEVDSFEELPDVEQARLHALAVDIWPGLLAVYEQAGNAAAGLTPEEVEQVAPQIMPELALSRDDMVQAANYKTAQRALEALWEMARDPMKPHPPRWP
jgi:hypothetical protein